MSPQFRGALLDDLLRAADAAGFATAPFRLTGAPRLDWVPAERHVQLDEAIAASLGLEALTSIGREAATISLQGSMFEPLVAGALRFFGPRPFALFRWAPGFWRVCCHEVGQLHFEVLDNGGRITIANVPREVGSSLAWRAEIRGRLLAGFDVVGVGGEVIEEPSESAIVFRVRWFPLT